MENINLIRKLAWTYHHRSGIEFDELFAEASLAYCEALNSYNENMKCKLSSYAWLVIRNHLVNVCKQNHRSGVLYNSAMEVELIPDTNVPESFIDTIKTWGTEFQEIAFIILEDPERFLGSTPNYKRHTGPATPKQRLKQELRNRGWSVKQIKRAFTHMPRLLAGNTL